MALTESNLSGRERISVNSLLPKEALVKEVACQGEVACGIAILESDKRQRLEVVTERYLRARYITPDDPRFQNGVFIDEYEAASIPIIAKIGEEAVASARLILEKSTIGLPIKREGIDVYPEWKEKLSLFDIEWSQLAKSRKIAYDARPINGVLRSSFAIAKALGKNKGFAVIDNRVMRILNGLRMNFNLPQIGPSINYMGSYSTPVYINVESIIENCGKKHKDLAQFLDGKDAPGFEWYVGL